MQSSKVFKCCGNCMWLSDDFTSVCVNDDSENCADFVGFEDCCEKWEASDQIPRKGG